MTDDRNELKQLKTQMESLLEELAMLTGDEDDDLEKAYFSSPYGDNVNPYADEISQQRMKRGGEDEGGNLGEIMEKIRTGEPLSDEQEKLLETALEAAQEGETEKADFTETLEPILTKLQREETLSEEDQDTLIEAVEAMMYGHSGAEDVQKAISAQGRYSARVRKAVEDTAEAIRSADAITSQYSPGKPILNTPPADQFNQELIDRVQKAAQGSATTPAGNPATGNHPIADMERGSKAEVMKSLFPEWGRRMDEAQQARKSAGQYDEAAQQDAAKRREVRKAAGAENGYDRQQNRRSGIKAGLRALLGQ